MWGLPQTLDSCPSPELLDMAQPRLSALVGSHSLEWRPNTHPQGRMEVGLEHQSRQASHDTCFGSRGCRMSLKHPGYLL